MGEVSGNAGCVDDIVEGELVHEGGELQEQGQRLAEEVAVSGSSCQRVQILLSAGSLPVQYRQRHQRQLFSMIHVSPNRLESLRCL